MPTIDVQVHCYERNHPGRPWHAVLAGPPEVTGPAMIKAMDEVGVDGALLISVYTMYKWDASYAVSVHKQFPNRFALIKPVDSNDPKVGETIEEWAKMDGTVAVRIMFTPEVSTDPAHPGINKVLATAGKCDLPVNLMARGRLDQVAELAKRHPDTTLVIDHLGLEQPMKPPAPQEPWVELPKLLALSTAQEHRGQDQRRLHAQPRAVPVQGHPQAGRSDSQHVRPRSLHVGHRLDARGEPVDLQAGRRCVPRQGLAVRQRPRHADGWQSQQDLRLGPEEGLNEKCLNEK